NPFWYGPSQGPPGPRKNRVEMKAFAVAAKASFVPDCEATQGLIKLTSRINQAAVKGLWWTSLAHCFPHLSSHPTEQIMTQTQAITQAVLRDVVGWLNRCPRQAHPRSEQEKSIMRTVIIAASAATALFSSPAFTQQPSQGTASIPAFSGIWAHLTFPDVE